MTWNWQLANWPNFTYDKTVVKQLEKDFLYKSGVLFGAYSHLNDTDYEQLKIELISKEAYKTSEIEGELLNRDSLQISLMRNFGLATDSRKVSPKEQGIAKMMSLLYQNYPDSLTEEMLHDWHSYLLQDRADLNEIGCYRTDQEAMQIISGRLDKPKIHFEAPPANIVKQEMKNFINWFNSSHSLPALTRAAIVHQYFITIHPFADGNGRIARALVIKSLSQSLGQPLLSSLSLLIEQDKKTYYRALESCNKTNQITEWLNYFAQLVISAQNYTENLIKFLIAKTKLYRKLSGQLNPRQEKMLQRLFKAGPEGFKGGLSAANYLAITKTTRATATRDLTDLVAQNVLSKTGQLKTARYHLRLDL